MPQILNINRPGPGLVTSGVQDVSAFAQPRTNYKITGVMQSAADLADTGLTCSYELRLDGNTVWGPNSWVGGITDRNGNPVPPSLQYSLGDAVPSTAEVRYTFNKQLAGRFTVDIDFEPAQV